MRKRYHTQASNHHARPTHACSARTDTTRTRAYRNGHSSIVASAQSNNHTTPILTRLQLACMHICFTRAHAVGNERARICCHAHKPTAFKSATRACTRSARAFTQAKTCLRLAMHTCMCAVTRLRHDHTTHTHAMTCGCRQHSTCRSTCMHVHQMSCAHASHNRTHNAGKTTRCEHMQKTLNVRTERHARARNLRQAHKPSSITHTRVNKRRMCGCTKAIPRAKTCMNVRASEPRASDNIAYHCRA